MTRKEKEYIEILKKVENTYLAAGMFYKVIGNSKDAARHATIYASTRTTRELAEEMFSEGGE